MKYTLVCRLLIITFVLFSVAPTSACIPLDSQEKTKMNENVIVIKVNTVFEYGDIKLGVGNIRTEEYVQQNGEKTKGMVAGIYVYHKTDPAQDRPLVVYAGFKEVVAGYDIEILDVNSTSVRLKIHPD